jgi:protein tyrosine phosphatase (PTP) superfamily phosphohydrolase (DUF442 family)
MMALGFGALGSGVGGVVLAWDRLTIKRFAAVEPGRITRGAWPGPGPLLRLIRDDAIRTVVTLTAINRDDPKFVAQEAAIRQTRSRWIIIPMRGSTATVEQMAEAADLVADPTNQPAFFHCVGGHHRSNLVHAAYLIRHRGASAADAWEVVSRLPWSRPASDGADRARIEEFAAKFGASSPEKDHLDEAQAATMDPSRPGRDDPRTGPVRRGPLGIG